MLQGHHSLSQVPVVGQELHGGRAPQHGIAGQPEIEDDHIGIHGERAAIAATPGTDVCRGLWTWAGITRRPAWRSQVDMASDGSGSSVTTRMVGLRAAIRLPPSCAIWLMLVVTGPPDMGQTPPAERGIRLYGTGPDWKSLRSVRKETLAGEARFDAKSEHLGRQEAPRINSQD